MTNTRPLMLAALLVVARFAAACERSPHEAPTRHDAPVTRVAADVERPVLSVPQPQHDFGQVLKEDELRHTFEIANPGHYALYLHIDEGNGCRPAEKSQRLEPGQRDGLAVVCRPTSSGPFLDGVIVRSSHDPDSPVAEQMALALRAQVSPAAAFDRQLLVVSLPVGATRVEEVRLIGARAAKVRLGQARIDLLAPVALPSAPAGGFKLNLDKLPATGHKAEGLRIRIKARSAGTQSGRIVIPTGLDSPSEVDLALSLTAVAR